MNRNVIIAGSITAVLVVAAVILFIVRNGGEMTALAQLDATIAAYSGSYEDASYDAAGDRLVVDGLVLHNYAVDADAEPLDLVEIGHLEVVGLARRNLANVFNGDDRQKILSQLNATDLTFTEAGQAIHLERLNLDNLVVVPLEQEIPLIGGSITRSQAVAQVLLTLHAGRAEILGFASPELGPTGIRMDHLTVTDVTAGEVANLSLDGFRLWDHGQVGTVGDRLDLSGEHLEVSAIDLRRPLQRMLANERVNFERQSDLPIFSTVDVDNIRVEEEGGAAISIGSMMLRNDDYIGAMPTATTFAMEDFLIPLTSQLLEPAQVQAITNLGYEELIFNLAYRSDFDPTTGSFEITGLTLGVEEMAELSLRFALSDVPFTEEMTEMTAEALLESGYVTQVLENAKMGRGELRFRDHGMMQRAIDQASAEQGQNPEEFLASVLIELDGQRQAMASSPEAVQAIDALSSFLSNPGQIALILNPEAPVPFSQVVVATQINPVLLVEMFNLEVAASE